MVAQHIHHTYLRDSYTEEFWALGHTGSYEQTAIRAAYDGQLIGTGVILANQVFCGTDKVVEHVLLLHLGSSQVPFLAIFVTTTQIDLRIDTALLEEGDASG